MDITYSNWAMFTLLPSLLIVLLAYVWMQSFYVGFNPKDWFKCFTEKNEGAKRDVVLNTEYFISKQTKKYHLSKIVSVLYQYYEIS